MHCHVSGAVSWFAPARFRSYIFSREMPLVLDSIVFAERHLFTCRRLRQAPVFVHFEAVEVCRLPPLVCRQRHLNSLSGGLCVRVFAVHACMAGSRPVCTVVGASITCQAVVLQLSARSAELEDAVLGECVWGW